MGTVRRFRVYTLPTGQVVRVSLEELETLYRELSGLVRLLTLSQGAERAEEAIPAPLEHAVRLAAADAARAPAVAGSRLDLWQQRTTASLRSLGVLAQGGAVWGSRRLPQVLAGVGLSAETYQRRLAEVLRVAAGPTLPGREGLDLCASVYREFGRRNLEALAELGFPASVYQELLREQVPDGARPWHYSQLVMEVDELLRLRSLPRPQFSLS